MLEILHSCKVVQSVINLTNLYLVSGVDVSKVESSVRAFKTVTEDVYISFNWQNATSAQLQMKVVPMINALWGGLDLLTMGLAIRMLVWPNAPSTKQDA